MVKEPGKNETRPRAREIGIELGIFRPGEYNGITDVKDVRVGHVTLVEGEGPLIPWKGPIRTGATAILPHSGNLFREKVPAAAFAMNGFGKATGLHQLNEIGDLETPLLLTNTLNVPLVADAVIEWSLGQNPGIGVQAGVGTVNPVVGEVNDGFLNDLQGRHVRKEQVFRAIERARPGPVEEGCVGGGTGSACMGFKGGIGTSSRVLPKSLGGYTVGALVQTNFDGALTINGVPVGRELGCFAYSQHFPREIPDQQKPDGSVMVVVATDAPLDQRQLERVARRVGLGLARTGFYSSNGSGDFFVAFSTAQRVPHVPGLTLNTRVVSNNFMSALFLATVEAVEEAVVNAVLKATTTVGRDGNTLKAVEVEDLVRIMERYNGLHWDKKLPPWRSPVHLGGGP